jgi:ADP-heptose:LPS heptosyltransferase
VRWYSLQYGASELPSNAIDIACRDLLEQARRVRALDLVITVDTLMAHLAGALGVPVWLLLPTPCDWRWMIDRTDSPWYPTMRLFRQPVSGDWNSVIADVCRALPNAAIIPSSTAP